jgi:predicted transcriptional regulator of viral defense system
MQFIDFKQNLNKFIVFSLADIRKVQADFDLRRLSEWQDKNYIKMIRRGYYIFSDFKIDEQILFIIANKIYSPSYISSEMALRYYNLIPESVYELTSVSSEKTNSFKNDLGQFSYRHLKPELMFGYQIIRHSGHGFKIAEIEKAILDFFYLNPYLKKDDDFEGLRINSEELKSQLDKDKFFAYLEAFNNKSLEKRIKKFFKHIKYA